MKRFFLLAAVTAMLTTAAVAQDQPAASPDKAAPEKKEVKQSPSEWEAKIKADLKLTAEQVEKFDALNKEYAPKIEAIMKDAALAEDVRKEKKMALKKEKEAKLLELLTPEQQTKYKEIKAEKEKHKESPKQ